MTRVGDLTVKSADSLTSAVLTCAHCWLTFRQSHSIRSSPIRHEILPVCAFCFTSSLLETNAQRREQISLHLGRDAGDRERVYPPLGLYTVTDDVTKYGSWWCYGNKVQGGLGATYTDVSNLFALRYQAPTLRVRYLGLRLVFLREIHKLTATAIINQNNSLSFDNLPCGPRPNAVVQVVGYRPPASTL